MDSDIYEPSRPLKTSKAIIRLDDGGHPFLVMDGVTYRPAPELLKDTADCRSIISEIEAFGVVYVVPSLDYMPYLDGQTVEVTTRQSSPSTRIDTIGVFTPIDPCGSGTLSLYPDGLPSGSGNFITWCDETAPILQRKK